MNPIPIMFYRCPRCQYTESTNNEIRSCNHCRLRRQLRNGIMCSLCSLSSTKCGFCGEFIQVGNEYIDFYRSKQKLEVQSAKKFFTQEELQKYLSIYNQKFEDFINQVQNKTREEMLTHCKIKYYSQT